MLGRRVGILTIRLQSQGSPTSTIPFCPCLVGPGHILSLPQCVATVMLPQAFVSAVLSALSAFPSPSYAWIFIHSDFSLNASFLETAFSKTCIIDYHQSFLFYVLHSTYHNLRLSYLYVCCLSNFIRM